MGNRPLSLALRLVLYFALITLFSMLVIAWFTEQSLKRHFEEEDLSEMSIIAQNVEQILSSNRARKDGSWRERRLEDILVGHHHATLFVRDSQGRTVFSSHKGIDLGAMMDSREADWMRLEMNGHRYRVLARNVAGYEQETYQFLVAVSFDYHEHFLEHFSRTLWFIVIVGIAVVALMAWLVVWRGLMPLHRIVDRIRHISVNQLQTRIEQKNVPRELIDLVTSFNGMTERLDDAFQRMSNFSADIAHELRTPITNLMTQTQVAMTRARSIDEYREVLYSNLEEFERLTLMINDMLFLARSDNGLQDFDLPPVDIATEVKSLFEFYDALAEAYGVEMEVSGSAVIPGNAMMLRRALSNLISNALRHTPKGGKVTVLINTSEPRECAIKICNTGEPLTEPMLSRVFDRFYHLKSNLHDEDPGTGLGLAIVKSIVEAHRGRVDVESADGVTTFTLHFPVVSKCHDLYKAVRNGTSGSDDVISTGD